jgi:predicted metal-binding membrane protein
MTTMSASQQVPMMVAMMLPAALPALLRSRRLQAALGFAASYAVVWALVGLAVYALWQPHCVVVAGVLTVAAGAYELTPLKRECRRRCRDYSGSGFGLGLWCLGSSLGLMLMLAAIGVMSLAWMTVVAALVLAQTLLPQRWSVDVPLALAIVALGIAVAVAPASIPALATT